MVQKIELGSPEWMDALKGHILRFLDTPSGKAANFSICEVFTGVPKHLDRNGDGVIAWYCRMKDGRLEFEYGAIDDADMKTTTDYDFIAPFARMKLGAESAEVIAAQMEAGAKAGKLVREGDSSGVPVEFHAIHNDLADITA